MTVTPAPEKVIVDVFALNVKFVFVAKDKAVPLLAKVILLLPQLIVLAPDPEEDNVLAVTLKLFVVNVPVVINS